MDNEEKSFDEYFLPLRTTSRILRQKLPKGYVISREVKNLLNQSASIFIIYLSAMAGEISKDKVSRNKKALISSDSINKALIEMDFSTIASKLFPSSP